MDYLIYNFVRVSSSFSYYKVPEADAGREPIPPFVGFVVPPGAVFAADPGRELEREAGRPISKSYG